MAGRFYIDPQGNITANRPMTLQENYGGLRSTPRQIEYTGGGRPVGTPSGISRPGIPSGRPSAVQTPPTGRNLPAVRPPNTPVLRPVAEPPTGLRPTPTSGFTLGPEGPTVSPARPLKPVAQIPYKQLEQITADEVRQNLARARSAAAKGAPYVRGGASARAAGAAGRTVLGRVAGPILSMLPVWDKAANTIDDVAAIKAATASGQRVDADLMPLRTGNVGLPRLTPADLSRMSDGSLPAPQKRATPPQTARFRGGAPSAPPSGDSHGYAIVDGKRINYQDIGTTRDPLARNDGMVSTPEGGTMLLGNPTAYRPIPQEERSARGIADLTPQETLVRNNERIQSDLATITANMGNQYDGEQQIAAAKMRIAALQNQNELLQRGIAGDQSLEGQKYVADMGLKGHQTNIEGQKYAADMGLKGHQIDRESNIDVARLYSDAQIRSASLGRKNRDNAQAAAEDKARLGVRNQVINSYDWTGINPTTANKYATIMAQTFDKPGYETFSDPQSRYNDVVLHPEIAANFGPTLRAARNSEEYAAILAEIGRLTNGQGVHHTGIANTRRLPRLKRAADAGLSGLNIQ